MVDFDILRQDLRGLDGDLYLCHLFAPSEHRDRLLTLYRLYADIARVPFDVSEPMLGAIRLQWWRDLIAATDKTASGAPVGEALQIYDFPPEMLLPLVDAREPALNRTAGEGADPSLEAEAAIAGPALIRAACYALDVTSPADELVQKAGKGFEWLRLAGSDTERHLSQMPQIGELLKNACRLFNALPRTERKSILPVFLAVGLARRHAAAFPRQKSLFAYQLSLLKMAFTGRL